MVKVIYVACCSVEKQERLVYLAIIILKHAQTDSSIVRSVAMAIFKEYTVSSEMKLIVRPCNTEQLSDVFLVEHKYMAQTENLICNYSLGYVSNNLDMLIIILFITNYTLCELESFRFITSVHKQFLLTVPEDNLPLC